MRTFFTWGSLLMASLLIYSACDSGVDTLDDRIDTPPGDLIEIEAVVRTPAQQALMMAMEEWAEAAIDNKIMGSCGNISHEELADLDAQFQTLLEYAQDGLSRDNIFEVGPTLDSEDWEAIPINLLIELDGAYQDYWSNYKALCSSGFVEALDNGRKIIQDHSDTVIDLGPDGFSTLLEEILANQATANCENWCTAKFVFKFIGIWGTAIGATAGCTALTAGTASAACGYGFGIAAAGFIAESAVDAEMCLAACEEKEDDDEDDESDDGGN